MRQQSRYIQNDKKTASRTDAVTRSLKKIRFQTNPIRRPRIILENTWTVDLPIMPCFKFTQRHTLR